MRETKSNISSYFHNLKNYINLRDIILFVTLAIMYTIAYNPAYRANSLLWYGWSLICILIFAFFVIKKKSIKINYFIIWSIVFYALCLLSMFWALDATRSLNTMKTLSLIYISHVLLSFLAEDKKTIKIIILANFIAFVLLAIYVLLNVDLNAIGEDRIGAGVGNLNDSWNANSIGGRMTMGFALALYFFVVSKKIVYKVVCLITGFTMSYITFFTGSRTALLMWLLITVFFIVFSVKKHRIFVFAVMAVCVVGLFFLIMNYKPLYNVLGVRFENLFKGLSGESGGFSFDTRAEMIKLGWQWFFKKPFFGYGIGNYSVLYGAQTGWSTYSHNNFIELLVGVGGVGFIIYYSIYAYIIFKGINKIRKTRDLLILILLLITVVKLFLHVSSITYTQTMYNCFLMLAVNSIKINE